jgi:GNAT superfamily N-acetyltransferase
MKIQVRNRCSDFNSYRAARVKSLFNAESGCNFNLDAELPIDDSDWKIGLIVGPSGSGKTSMGRQVFGPEALKDLHANWPDDKPIVDAISPGADFDAITGALAAVGLGDVPAWLRPFAVLSNGEKFRAGLARVICEAPERIVVDEFTSVVDRQIAKFGALAFQKAWRRTPGQCVLLSCHYDIIDWLEPDWIFDTATGKYSGRCLWRRPKFDLEIWQTDGSYWPLFEPHHYLKLPRMIAATYYVGTVDGEPVCHVAASPRLNMNGMRACRLVVMPEWQGAGVGMRFLNWVCQHQLDGGSRWGDRVKTVYFHTSHPGLCAALRRDRKWRQVSAAMFGGNKARSASSIARSACAKGTRLSQLPAAGYGGHFRAVQGFKYVGEAKR